eukprot:2427856-Prorocentrum_lima.AAC.1
MTSSLVGSEMCIRDRTDGRTDGRTDLPTNRPADRPTPTERWTDGPTIRPVSYTHLTLPTICSV